MAGPYDKDENAQDYINLDEYGISPDEADLLVGKQDQEFKDDAPVNPYKAIRDPRDEGTLQGIAQGNDAGTNAGLGVAAGMQQGDIFGSPPSEDAHRPAEDSGRNPLMEGFGDVAGMAPTEGRPIARPRGAGGPGHSGPSVEDMQADNDQFHRYMAGANAANGEVMGNLRQQGHEAAAAGHLQEAQVLGDLRAKTVQAADDALDRHVAQQHGLSVARDTITKLNDAAGESKINPSRFIENMGVGGQILAALGVAAATVLFGPDGFKMATGAINTAIDRDIAAQKEDYKHKLDQIDGKKSLYAMARESGLDDDQFAKWYHGIVKEAAATHLDQISATTGAALEQNKGAQAAQEMRNEGAKSMMDAQASIMDAATARKYKERAEMRAAAQAAANREIAWQHKLQEMLLSAQLRQHEIDHGIKAEREARMADQFGRNDVEKLGKELDKAGVPADEQDIRELESVLYDKYGRPKSEVGGTSGFWRTVNTLGKFDPRIQLVGGVAEQLLDAPARREKEIIDRSVSSEAFRRGGKTLSIHEQEAVNRIRRGYGSVEDYQTIHSVLKEEVAEKRSQIEGHYSPDTRQTLRSNTDQARQENAGKTTGRSGAVDKALGQTPSSRNPVNFTRR